MLGTEPDVNTKHPSTGGSSSTLRSSNVLPCRMCLDSWNSQVWISLVSPLMQSHRSSLIGKFCTILFSGIVQMPRSRSSEWPLTSSTSLSPVRWRFCTRAERTSPRRSEETAHGQSACDRDLLALTVRLKSSGCWILQAWISLHTLSVGTSNKR